MLWFKADTKCECGTCCCTPNTYQTNFQELLEKNVDAICEIGSRNQHSLSVVFTDYDVKSL